MNRETIEVTSTAGHKVLVNTYLTGKEANEAKAVLFGGATMTAGEDEKPKVPLANALAHEQKILSLLVVSFDGDTNAPLAKMEDLPNEEYTALVAEIKKTSKAFLGQTK